MKVRDAISTAYRAFVPKDLPLLRMTEEEFESLADEHEAPLKVWSAHLDGLMARAPRRAFAARALEELPFEARSDVKSRWDAVLDLLVAVDRVKTFHEHFAAVESPSGS